LAFPPDNIKAGKQGGPPALIRLDPNAPNKFKGKFPTPIERFIQRIQNYFSVYNPPEYLNDLQRPGINNPENEEDVVDQSNDTQIILPCNGTSTIVIIPVPLENENISTDLHTSPDKSEAYEIPTTPKPHCPSVESIPVNLDTLPTPNNCPNKVTAKPNCTEEVTTIKPKPSTPKQTPCTEAVTTTKPKCPEATTPKPKCPETTPKSNCPEVATTTSKPKCLEESTPKPKCPEDTTPKPKCPEETTLKPKCPEVTTPTPKPNCPEMTTQKSPCPPKYSPASSDFKPISGYGASETPPPNPTAKPVLGSTVIYFYKNPSTLRPNPPSYYIPSNMAPYEDHTHKPKPPIARLKQLLFPRLYAAFHPEDD